MRKEAELTTVSSKGQVVIPQMLRRELGLKPKTKLLVYGKKDTIVLKKIRIPKISEDWERIAKIIDERNRKYGKLSEKDIQKEIEAYRKEKIKLNK